MVTTEACDGLGPGRSGGRPIPLVALRNVTKQYGNGTLALDRVSLEIESGSFVSLLGASGCGKSTILKMLAGFFGPSAGELAWTPPRGSGPSKRVTMGYVFQDSTLMPWATAIENVRLALDLQAVSRKEADARSLEALESVGLGRCAKAFPRELSGGMKMRVSLARALVTRPRLLLLDEPFAALDEITRFRLNEEISALWESQKFTAIFVTHSVFESVFLSTRIVVMAGSPGRIAADIEVPFSGPRDDALRTTPGYTELTSVTTEALKAAMKPPSSGLRSNPH